MSIVNKLMDVKARNSKCPCGSGLKFKMCHGDQKKTKTANMVANLAMGVMVHYQRQRSGLETEEVCDEKVGQIMELMYNILDPDYKPPQFEAVPRSSSNEVIESEDRKQEREEEVIPKSEETGQEKINSIRESAGVDRCPKCRGVKLVEEELCYKCKKGV